MNLLKLPKRIQRIQSSVFNTLFSLNGCAQFFSILHLIRGHYASCESNESNMKYQSFYLIGLCCLLLFKIRCALLSTTSNESWMKCSSSSAPFLCEQILNQWSTTSESLRNWLEIIFIKYHFKNSLNKVGFRIWVADIALIASVINPDLSAPPLMQLTITGGCCCLSSAFCCLKDVIMLPAMSNNCSAELKSIMFNKVSRVICTIRIKPFLPSFNLQQRNI